MQVLLTGAFGNLGSCVLDALLERGHRVRCLDLPGKAGKKTAAGYAGRVEVVWGDIRDRELLQQAVQGVDAVIHMAAIIPPLTESQPELAWQVNVQATESLLQAAAACATPPLFVFASSFAVFGYRQSDAPPRTLHDKTIESDHYSAQKIACEQLIQRLAGRWCILRLGASADERLQHASRPLLEMMFALAADNRVEFVHPKDVATAMANALVTPEAHNRIHLIGGGRSCQVRHFDLVEAMTGAMGLHFRPQDFGDQPLYADWADTTESQRLLQFQQHSFARLRQTVYRKYRPVRWLLTPFSPLLRWLMLRLFGPQRQAR